MDHFPDDLRKEYDLIDGQVGASPDEGIISGGILPYTPLLAAMRFHPQHVHKLLQLMTDFAIEGIKEQEKIVGKATRARLFAHMPTLLNREQYKEFWVPYFQQVAKEVRGAVVVWHNEGKSDHILDLIPREIDEWDTYCQTDLRLAKKIVGDRITFVGGIDPIEIMWRGTPADMDAAVKEIIAIAGPGGGLVVGRGGSQPYMRYEMYRAMIDAVKKYGKKPYPTDYIPGARLHRVTTTGGEISPELPVYRS
jgi:uroporphyrinogen decarboxylase